MCLDILIEIDEGGISERSVGSIAGTASLGILPGIIVPPGGIGPAARRHCSSSVSACSLLWC